MSSKDLIGQTVTIPTGYTDKATRKVIVKKYEEGVGYLCENLPDEPMFFGWAQEVYDDEANEL